MEEDYFFKYNFVSFPVRKIDEIMGIVTINDIKTIPREEWGEKVVAEITRPLNDDMVISPECTVTSSLNKLTKNGIGRILVMEDGELLGIVSNTDILNYIRIQGELK